MLKFLNNATFNICQRLNCVPQKSKKARTQTVVKEIKTSKEKTERGLYCISSGTLGELLNKALRKKKFKNHQRLNSKLKKIVMLTL